MHIVIWVVVRGGWRFWSWLTSMQIQRCTVIFRQTSQSTAFDCTFNEYRTCFGNLSDGHWLGLDIMAAVTSGDLKYELRVQLTNCSGHQMEERYEEFAVRNINCCQKHFRFHHLHPTLRHMWKPHPVTLVMLCYCRTRYFCCHIHRVVPITGPINGCLLHNQWSTVCCHRSSNDHWTTGVR